MMIEQARFVEDTGAKQGIEWLVARSHLSERLTIVLPLNFHAQIVQ